jgi:hypothetical protein
MSLFSDTLSFKMKESSRSSSSVCKLWGEGGLDFHHIYPSPYNNSRCHYFIISPLSSKGMFLYRYSIHSSIINYCLFLLFLLNRQDRRWLLVQLFVADSDRLCIENDTIKK